MTTATLSLLNFGNHADPSLGSDARAVHREVREIAADDVSTYYELASFPRASVVAAVTEAIIGDVASVRPEAIEDAFALAGCLPPGIDQPTIEIERDGQIGFDWHVDRDHALSLNVGRGGMIGYAALHGAESTYGRLPFAGTLPRTILELLRTIVAEPPQA